jgi:hypothetical protein
MKCQHDLVKLTKAASSSANSFTVDASQPANGVELCRLQTAPFLCLLGRPRRIRSGDDMGFCRLA